MIAPSPSATKRSAAVVPDKLRYQQVREGGKRISVNAFPATARTEARWAKDIMTVEEGVGPPRIFILLRRKKELVPFTHPFQTVHERGKKTKNGVTCRLYEEEKGPTSTSGTGRSEKKFPSSHSTSVEGRRCVDKPPLCVRKGRGVLGEGKERGRVRYFGRPGMRTTVCGASNSLAGQQRE